MIDEDLLDRVAQAVHQNYLREQQADGVEPGSTPSMRAWSELGEELRDANRAHARAMAATLALIDATIGPAGPDEPAFAFTPDELERLARHEHDRFSQRRFDAGWSYGPVRDDAALRHPSLVGWDELSESERDKDRDAIRNIPAALDTVGLAVHRS